MERPWLALLLGLGVALGGAACATPAPRIPFGERVDWHAYVLHGNWVVNKDFAQPERAFGVELVLDQPGTGGWAFEVGARYADGEGDGVRVVERDSGPIDVKTIRRSEREIAFYELDLGVRQVFYPDADHRPHYYVGVGLAALQQRTEEHYVQPVDFPVFTSPTPVTDHEREEIRPGLYLRSGVIWNLLRDQLGEETEIPVALDVRALLSFEYSYIEFALAIGFGR